MNILVRGTNWVGDAVMTIPAIRELRRLFPDAKITLHTREATAGLFRASGSFDEIITPDSLIDQVRSIRRRRFDLAVIFPNSFASALAARLGGVKRIFGYASERRSLLLTDPVDVPAWKETRHEVFYYLNLIAAIEKSYFGTISGSVPLEPQIEVSANERERARAMLLENGIDLSRRIVALAPGSTNSEAKRWTPEGFASVNDELQEGQNAQVVLLGSTRDKEVARRVSELSNLKPVDLTGETDIAIAAALLNEVDLLISNDMGLAHLAPAVGTETLVIFGPTNPITTRPFSERARVISANVECSPCMLRDCPIDHRCMTRVSAENVVDEAKKALSK